MLHGFPSFPHTTRGAVGKAPDRTPIIADLAPLKVSFPALLKEEPMRRVLFGVLGVLVGTVTGAAGYSRGF
jgi:hypothetical protein